MRLKLAGAAALGAALAISACGGEGTGPGPGVARLTLDLHALVAAGAPIVDPVSVLDSAKLTISSASKENLQVVPLGLGDTSAVFDVSVEKGSVRFHLDILSTNQSLLYQGDASSTIDQDGFAVSMTPAPVNPVMVIWPRTPPFGQDGTLIIARWLLRNAGPDSLVWHVDSIEGLQECSRLRGQPTFENCFAPQTTGSGTEPDTVVVFLLATGAGGPGTISFSSNTGDAVFATGLP
jgi:hypothetical protein